MKRKIVFMVINMNIGGTEKALLNLIANMPEDKYDITVLMLEKTGGFLHAIPPHVHVQSIAQYKTMKDSLNKPPKKVIFSLLKAGNLFKSTQFLYYYMMAKIMRKRHILFQYLLKQIPNLQDNYDVAIAYAGPMDFISYFVIHKINAKKKIQWIHFDITKIGFNKYFALSMYNQFDHIYGVSETAVQKLRENLPQLKYKMKVFPNMICPKTLHDMAQQGHGFTDHFNGLRILTVGRLSIEKGQDLMISVMNRLKCYEYDIRWYCIGAGPEKTHYEQLILDYGLEDDVVLLGAQTNPYPFLKQCDIYVQPSRHEGYCLTLAEAKSFNKPIVCTNFTGAEEQIVTGETGLIVPFSEQDLMEALIEIIRNPNLRKRLVNNLLIKINENRQCSHIEEYI